MSGVHLDVVTVQEAQKSTVWLTSIYFAFVARPWHLGIIDRFKNCIAPRASSSYGVVSWDCPGTAYMNITGYGTHETSCCTGEHGIGPYQEHGIME